MWWFLSSSNDSKSAVKNTLGRLRVRTFVTTLLLASIASTLVFPLTGLGSPQISTQPVSVPSGSIGRSGSDERISQEAAATMIMEYATHSAVWGPPAWCQVRQQIRVHKQQFSGAGKFIRGGQGTGKLNLSLEMSASDEKTNELLQVSDGTRLQTIEQLGERRRRTIVDLLKVQKRLSRKQTYQDRIASMYLAIGGPAESLRKLTQQYHWHGLREEKHEGQEVWVLSGTIRTEAPERRPAAMIDNKLFEPNLSGLQPTEAEVTIAKPTSGAKLPYWLYRVEFHRFADQATPLNDQPEMRLTIEWAEPKALTNDQLTEEHFLVTSTIDPFDEETELYLPPVQ